MMVVIHEMQFAREVSKRVLFFNAGILEEESNPQEVFANPRSDRLRAFLSRISCNQLNRCKFQNLETDRNV